MKKLILLLLSLIIIMLFISGCTIYNIDCNCKDYKRDKDGEYYPDFVTRDVSPVLRAIDTTHTHWIKIANEAKIKTDVVVENYDNEAKRIIYTLEGNDNLFRYTYTLTSKITDCGCENDNKKMYYLLRICPRKRK